MQGAESNLCERQLDLRGLLELASGTEVLGTDTGTHVEPKAGVD